MEGCVDRMHVIEFDYMYKNTVMSHVIADYGANKVKVTNYTDDIIFTPFGVNMNPTIDDFEAFLESRCFPRERRNCKQLLDDLGLINYSPILIVMKTHGRQLEDYCWIKFKGEDLDYERDIRLRD